MLYKYLSQETIPLLSDKLTAIKLGFLPNFEIIGAEDGKRKKATSTLFVVNVVVKSLSLSVKKFALF